MVQIMQAGPSAATLRQQALDEALNGTIQGFANYDKQKKDETATKRQQALQNFQLKSELSKQGYDVSTDQISNALNGQNADSLFTNRTKEWQDNQAAQLKKQELDNLTKQFDLEYKKEILKDLESQRPLKLEEMKARIEKLREDKLMSPIARRKAEAEIQKMFSESSQGGAEKKLSKMGGETQNKVGAIASGLKAISELGNSIGKGDGPKYIDANTPVIGSMISDTLFTQNQRVLDEVIGRLQSGGAIGADEEKRFRSMGPRPGDSPAMQAKKLQDQKTFLQNKLTAFGMNEGELVNLGFDTGNNGQQQNNKVANVPSFEEWKKSKGL